MGAVPRLRCSTGIVEEFAVDFAAGAHLTGDADQARNLLADALPPGEVDELLDSALGEGREADVWEAFASTPESAIIAFLNRREAHDRNLSRCRGSIRR